MANWLGCSVSIKSMNRIFQGEICDATGTTLTLKKVFCDGVPVETLSIVFTISDIEDLKLIEKQPSASVTGRSTITVAKPVAKRAARSTSESSFITKTNNVQIPPNVQAQAQTQVQSQVQSQSQAFPKSKPIDIVPKFVPNDFQSGASGSGSGSFNKSGTPNKNAANKMKMKWKDEACFGSPLEQSINQDFDFEKNLALFNKQAVWEEINASQKPDIVKHTDSAKKPTKYRHDENVIATVPTTYRQITVPKKEIVIEYVTDDGLVIPSISAALRTRLFSVADRVGLCWQRRTELMGRAATEIALQLLGGGHRLNPHNTHQWPNVVVLCGPHKEGAIGVNCARQLDSHGVNAIVYVPYANTPELQTELSLYQLTKNKILTSASALPRIADLIIVALSDGSDTPQFYPELVAWINNNRAAVLAIDPPASGTPCVFAKYSLVPVLPLSHAADNGKIYLCNLGFPAQIFNEVGIKYRSPFGPKFVIPLHPNDT